MDPHAKLPGLRTTFGSHLTYLPYGTPGNIYRTAEPTAAEMADRMTYLKAGKIGVIVLLTEPKEYLERGLKLDLKVAYERQGFEVIAFPIKDFSAPNDAKELAELADQIYRRVKKGENFVVHCKGGKGRTGMVLAAVANRVLNKNGAEAITWVRQFVASAVEMKIQERYVEKVCEIPYNAEQEEFENAMESFVTIELSKESSAENTPEPTQETEVGYYEFLRTNLEFFRDKIVSYL